MEREKLRLGGIYDNKGMQLLREMGIQMFSFDFRPRSLNFLQQHRFLEILQQQYRPEQEIFLHFAQEKDFVVRKFLDDVQEFLARKNWEHARSKIFLEFSDVRDPAYYDQFAFPYYWHFTNLGELKTQLNAKNLSGILLSSTFCEKLHMQQQFASFVRQLLMTQYSSGTFRALSYGLLAQWHFNLFPALRETVDWLFISLDIDPAVEICYRNVDVDKMQKNLQAIRGQLQDKNL